MPPPAAIGRTRRDAICAPEMAQPADKVGAGRDWLEDLKILVSAVQSRPCPSFSQVAFTDRQLVAASGPSIHRERRDDSGS
jgi:hypothetical protein